MANVQHSALTGANLHEPKGVAAAAANKVYITDGAGSGDLDKIGSSQLYFSANPFGMALLHVQDSKSSGTAGDALTAGSWSTRDITTAVTNEITGASLGSNQVTLPAGTFFVDTIVHVGAAQNAGRWQAALYNVTDGSFTRMGTSAVFGGDSAIPPSTIRGRFTIAAQKVFDIRAYAVSGSPQAITAMGVGQTEVYLDGCFWQIA